MVVVGWYGKQGGQAENSMLDCSSNALADIHIDAICFVCVPSHLAPAGVDKRGHVHHCAAWFPCLPRPASGSSASEPVPTLTCVTFRG